MVKPVLTKRNFVKRYAKGEFGNHSPTWKALDRWLLDQRIPGTNPRALFHIRNRVAGGPTWYNLLAREVVTTWGKITANGVDPSTLYISAMAPSEKTIFQGEVSRGVWSYELTYTTVAKPMREALKEQTHVARGIIAITLLRKFLCERSYDWLMYLLDNYEGHVVEFSTYSVEWGTLPGYNTVFWEVRKY